MSPPHSPEGWFYDLLRGRVRREEKKRKREKGEKERKVLKWEAFGNVSWKEFPVTLNMISEAYSGISSGGGADPEFASFFFPFSTFFAKVRASRGGRAPNRPPPLNTPLYDMIHHCYTLGGIRYKGKEVPRQHAWNNSVPPQMDSLRTPFPVGP